MGVRLLAHVAASRLTDAISSRKASYLTSLTGLLHLMVLTL